jgi:hypothetical protein
VGGGFGTGGGTGARPGREPAGGIAGKRQPVDEYIASLPTQIAFIGGKTLETLTSLPPMPQTGRQSANVTGVIMGIGINNFGFNKAGGTVTGNPGGAENATKETGTSINNKGWAWGGVNTFGGVKTGVNNAGGLGGAYPYDTNTTGNIGVADAEYADDEAVDTGNADENEKTGDTGDEETDNAGIDTGRTGAELSPEEQSVVNELRNRDREVRAHEQAHVSAGGAYIRGGVSYRYQRGPDNRSYAVGGEVGIDTAPERDDPGATITKMQAVRAAALAPADPSAQDRAVAAAAARNESAARAELAKEEQDVSV